MQSEFSHRWTRSIQGSEVIDRLSHSEHYLHSTFFDNVFANLLGIIPTLDDRLELRPLVPDNWTHFAVENLPYHGL